jgi:hypothetical protein
MLLRTLLIVLQNLPTLYRERNYCIPLVGARKDFIPRIAYGAQGLHSTVGTQESHRLSACGFVVESRSYADSAIGLYWLTAQADSSSSSTE